MYLIKQRFILHLNLYLALHIISNFPQRISQLYWDIHYHKLGENELKNKSFEWVKNKRQKFFLLIAFNKFCDFILCLNYNQNNFNCLKICLNSEHSFQFLRWFLVLKIVRIHELPGPSPWTHCHFKHALRFWSSYATDNVSNQSVQLSTRFELYCIVYLLKFI